MFSLRFSPMYIHFSSTYFAILRVMKLVYLNVWGDHMRDELVDFLVDQTQDTDIFCFQEATDSMKRRCQDILSNYVEIKDDKYISEHDLFLQSIFVKKTIDVVSSGTLLDKSKTDYGLALYIEVKSGDETMYVCNVHGTARPHNKLDSPGRIHQSEEIIEFFKDKDVSVVIGGDFNMEPKTESIEMFENAGYRDLIKEFAIDTTRNNLAWERFPTKMYYSDYVFTKKLKVEHFSVPKNEISDHLPLIVEVISVSI